MVEEIVFLNLVQKLADHLYKLWLDITVSFDIDKML
jgi:hypothetical protein